jgi:hypothetical protein
MSYGVTPTGFNRPRVPELLAEIEEKARGIFGSGVVQTAQSPLGQLNGMFAELVGTLWEAAENTYQSYDPDQAEGVRLEQLGRMRLLERIDGELDPAYRQAITNAGRARLDIAGRDLVQSLCGRPLLDGSGFALAVRGGSGAWWCRCGHRRGGARLRGAGD